MYCSSICVSIFVCSWADGNQASGQLFGVPGGSENIGAGNGNNRPSGLANVFTLTFTLLAGSVGLATVLMAAAHSMTWSEESRFGDLASNTVTLGLVS